MPIPKQNQPEKHADIKRQLLELEEKLFNAQDRLHPLLKELFADRETICHELKRIEEVIAADEGIADKAKERQVRLSNLLSQKRWKKNLVLPECENNPDRIMAYELWDWSQAELLWQNYYAINQINDLLVEHCLFTKQ